MSAPEEVEETGEASLMPAPGIVLHRGRIEEGTRWLIGAPYAPTFGRISNTAMLPAGAKPYHWGTVVSSGRLTLLAGPDPREALREANEW